jgi:hypothetical protein
MGELMSSQRPQPSFETLAAGEIDGADALVLARLSGLYEALDPVPTGLVERVQFGITLDALTAEIAELQRAGDLVGVRGDEATAAQTVTFTSASLTTMVTITAASADLARIDGWVAPGGEVTVELRLQGQTLRTVADLDGRFVFDRVPRGLAQFVLRTPSAGAHAPVITPSIEI